MDQVVADLIGNTMFLILYIVFGGILTAEFFAWIVRLIEGYFNTVDKENKFNK